MWFCTAVVMLMLTALPAIAAADYVDCSPAACPSPVLGPGNHQDVETR